MSLESQTPDSDDATSRGDRKIVVIDHRKPSAVRDEQVQLLQPSLDPQAVERMRQLEADPVRSRRAWIAAVGGGAAFLAAERLNRLFTKTGREGEPSPILSSHIADDHASIISERISESEAEPVRESVWDRKPGPIQLGETIYSPISSKDGKITYVSLQFVDETRRKTLLLVDGEECEQTADGLPVKINSIELLPNGTIQINGVAMILLTGTSTWDAQKIADMKAALKKDEAFPFDIAALVKSNGLIRKREKPEANQSEDTAEEEPQSAEQR